MAAKVGLYSISKGDFFGTLNDMTDEIKKVNDNVNSVAKSLIWQAPVSDVAALATTYPTPVLGWASMVTSLGFVYSWNGTAWKDTGLKAFPEDVLQKTSQTLTSIEKNQVRLNAELARENIQLKGIKSSNDDQSRLISSAIIKFDLFVSDVTHEYGIDTFGYYDGIFYANVFDLTTNTLLFSINRSFTEAPTGLQVFENNTSSLNWMVKFTIDCDVWAGWRVGHSDESNLKIIPKDIKSDEAYLFIDKSNKLVLDSHFAALSNKGILRPKFYTNVQFDDYAARSIESIALFVSDATHNYAITQFGYMASIQAFLFVITDTTLNTTLCAQYFVFGTAPTGMQTFQLSGDGYFIKCIVDCDKYYSLYGNTDSALSTAEIGVKCIDIKSDEARVYFNTITPNVDSIAKVTDINILKVIGETWTDFLYSNYVGYSKPSDKDCYLKSLEFTGYNTGVTTDTLIEFSLLTIDQRNWLLPRLTFTLKPSSISPCMKFDFTGLKIKKYAGEILMVRCIPTANTLVFSLSDDSFDADNLLVYGELTGTANYHATKGAIYWKEDVRTIDSTFAENTELSAAKETISALNAQVAKMNVIKDSITGTNYRLKVINGNMSISSMEYANALFIGHSYFNASANGGLGVSVEQNDIPHLMLSTMNSQHTISTTPNIQGGVDFERGYDTYDLTLWDVSLVTTLKTIVICLGANATYSSTMQARWEAMINHVKSRCPNADIYCSDAWCGGDVHTAIKNACLNTAVTYVDMNGSGYLPTTKFSLGDYTYNPIDGYQPITNTGVAAHPNDFGSAMITDAYLDAMSYNKTTKHNIIINKSGIGTITTASLVWLENGIVSLKITGILSTISAVDSNGATITLTSRTNAYGSYRTFIMPDSDVIITAVFI